MSMAWGVSLVHQEGVLLVHQEGVLLVHQEGVLLIHHVGVTVTVVDGKRKFMRWRKR